ETRNGAQTAKGRREDDAGGAGEEGEGCPQLCRADRGRSQEESIAGHPQAPGPRSRRAGDGAAGVTMTDDENLRQYLERQVGRLFDGHGRQPEIRGRVRGSEPITPTESWASCSTPC